MLLDVGSFPSAIICFSFVGFLFFFMEDEKICRNLIQFFFSFFFFFLSGFSETFPIHSLFGFCMKSFELLWYWFFLFIIL